MVKYKQLKISNLKNMDFTKVRYVLFFSLLIFITGLFFYIISPFAYPLYGFQEFKEHL